jgi:hypothetical protein
MPIKRLTCLVLATLATGCAELPLIGQKKKIPHAESPELPEFSRVVSSLPGPGDTAKQLW